LSRSLSPSPGRLLALAALVISSFFLVLGAHPAHAAFPGANGKIAFDRYTQFATTEVANARDGAPASKNAPRSSRLVSFSDQIFTINPDATGETNVSNNSFLDEYANWSADGLKIAFDRFDNGEETDQVFSMNGDGSAQTDISNNTDEFAQEAAWSPDRSKVAYSLQTGSQTWEIWVMNADGSGKHVVAPATLSPGIVASENYLPNWSPDGTKIAYTHYQENEPVIKVQAAQQYTYQVFVVNADGSGTPQNVSNNSDDDEDPNWSPNGQQLAFVKYVDGQGQIWVMNADGSNPHLVASSTDRSDEAPAFSPDGTQIAYQTDLAARSLRGGPNPQEIWIVGADGQNDHQLTSPAVGLADYAPDWQPVGAPAATASLPACTGTASAVLHVADATGFLSALNVHYKVDGGAEQVAAADGSGNAAIALSNGAHTVEFWGGDAAGYQEAAHHTAATKVDTVDKCAPAPKVSVAGVRRACVSKAFNIRVHISSASKPKSVRVYLGKKRIASTTKTTFTLHINVKKLGRHTRLRIVATSSNGKVTTIRRTIARCAVAKPRHKAAPRFTG
jgi:Tol biopolymer transport system component